VTMASPSKRLRLHGISRRPAVRGGYGMPYDND